MNKTLLESLFIKNGADTTKPHIIGAIASACAGIATCCTELNKEDIKKAVLKLYNMEELDGLDDLTNMSPSYVKTNIGFSIDFKDYNASKLYYELNKEALDSLYNSIITQKQEDKKVTALH